MNEAMCVLENKPRYVNLWTAAKHFGCSRRHLERLLAAGVLGCLRVGKLVRLDLAVAEEQLKQHSSGMVAKGQDAIHA